MRNNFWYAVAFILICLGVVKLYDIVSLIVVDKKDYRYELKQEYDKAKYLYGFGRDWGSLNAQYMIDNEEYIGETPHESALYYLNNPGIDFTCNYISESDEDCYEMPTKEILLEKYNVYDYKETNYPVYAFTSGFIDGFKLYIEENR